MCVVRMQKPYGGCVNCGKPVRSMKQGNWMCQRCIRSGNRTPESPGVRMLAANRAWNEAKKREREAADVFRACLIEALNSGQEVRHAAMTLNVSMETVRNYVKYV